MSLKISKAKKNAVIDRFITEVIISDDDAVTVSITDEDPVVNKRGVVIPKRFSYSIDNGTIYSEDDVDDDETENFSANKVRDVKYYQTNFSGKEGKRGVNDVIYRFDIPEDEFLPGYNLLQIFLRENIDNSLHAVGIERTGSDEEWQPGQAIIDVFSKTVIPHLAGIDRSLKRISRYLKKGAEFIDKSKTTKQEGMVRERVDAPQERVDAPQERVDAPQERVDAPQENALSDLSITNTARKTGRRT